MEEKTEQESDMGGSGRLVEAPETSRACRIVYASLEKLEHTGHAETESGLSATERAVGKYPRAALAKKERNKAVC